MTPHVSHPFCQCPEREHEPHCARRLGYGPQPRTPADVEAYAAQRAAAAYRVAAERSLSAWSSLIWDIVTTSPGDVPAALHRAAQKISDDLRLEQDEAKILAVLFANAAERIEERAR